MTLDELLVEVTRRSVQYEMLSDTSFKLIHPTLGTECLVIRYGERFESYHSENGLLGLCADLGMTVNRSF